MPDRKPRRSATAPGKCHALLIGVDRYLHRSPGEQLAGCVNDVEAMRAFLVDRAGVARKNLRCLTSPPGPGRTLASAANIRAAFAALLADATLAARDHLVLFLAGHGVRLDRAVGAARNRHYGFIAADVAADLAGGSAAWIHVILDREIHALLRGLAARGVTITVIADTCHAGSAMRDDDDSLRERSLELPAPADAPWAAILAAAPAPAYAPAGHLGAWPGDEFVVLAACHDHETAKEESTSMLDADGAPRPRTHGVLTLALLTELARVPADQVAGLRWLDLAERVQAAVARRIAVQRRSSQTPAVEGRSERPVFGGAWRPFAPGFTVRLGPDGALRLDGGTLHGLDPGAVIAIHPPNTADLDDPATPGAPAVITDAQLLTSQATLHDPHHIVHDRARARLVRSAATTPVLRVRLIAGPGQLIPDIAAAARAVRNAAACFRLVAEDGERPPELALRPWFGPVPVSAWPQTFRADAAGARDGWALVRGEHAAKPVTPADDVIAYLPGAGPPIDRLARTAEERARLLGDALGAALIAHHRHTRTRAAASDDELAAMLGVALHAGTGAPPTDALQAAALTPLARTSDGYRVREDQWLLVRLRVATHADPRLQIAFLGLSDAGDVVPFWPADGQTPGVSGGDILHLGFDRFAPLQLIVRADQQESRWTLRILACLTPGTPAPLGLGSLAQAPMQALLARQLFTRDFGPPQLEAEDPAVNASACHTWDLPVIVTRTGA